ncbi:MAG: phospholipase D-like domain-containing protein [Isosphaeraceae bacterium]|nr:phospholipase D-like domain-containing protein [Isosphaeraceae bacterium]
MASRANRPCVQIGVTCEVLETRRLLTGSAHAHVSGLGEAARPPQAPALFIEPQAGRAPILDAIDSARSTIRLGICNISDPQIGAALGAAVARGVNVEVIVDQADYHAKSAEQAEVASLLAQGVAVHLSNPVFPQSFEKELVIDQTRAVIMTMCLVPQTFQDTRDYGLILANPAIIKEVTSVFDNDWAYSAPPGQPTPAYNPTPPLHVPTLIWGPTNATAKLSQLIQSARRTIDVTTELLDDPYLDGQLIAAAHRGVRVQLICPVNTREGTSNASAIALLAGQGVNVRVTPDQNPPANAPPYMHAKTMIVDGRVAYLGSIDLDTIEATQDRELGIIFRQRPLVAQLGTQFQTDWSTAQAPPLS